MTTVELILLYLLIINILTFATYGLDKLKARYHRRRISEFTLLMLAILGGSMGAWAGMYLFRHKTQHKKFKYGIPAIVLLQLSVFYIFECH